MQPSTPVGTCAWVCLALGCLSCLPVVQRLISRCIFNTSTRLFLVAVAAVTFALSVAYVHVYLGAAPRIIDATAYLLQAKIFASGAMSFVPPGALHSYAGRFLVVTPNNELSVLFPPGYAAVLALGVKLNVPLLVNPVIGSALTVLTYCLGAQWFSERVGRIAAVLSVLCACLRYHSADTMSHVWTALLVVGVLLTATAKQTAKDDHTTERTPLPLVAGLCAGLVFATRPLTGAWLLPVGLALLWSADGVPASIRLLLRYAVGVIPGFALWWSYQWVTTGSPWLTTQGEYYGRSDWPEHCFRLGFAVNIGCGFEHEDFLRTYQPNGFGPIEALHVTLRRLARHHRDIANLPAFGAVGVLALTIRDRSLRSRALLVAVLVLGHVAAYSLFYFDGNYPGGGARLLVDVLPLEHLLLGVVLVHYGFERVAVPACFIGFALWGAADHEVLARREGGRPMFEPKVASSVAPGLIYVDTDHGFNLGFQPNADPFTSVQVARRRRDGFDYATWQALGRPPAYSYQFDPYTTDAVPLVIPFVPGTDTLFAGASLWPSLAITHGSVVPDYSARGLRLLPHKGEVQTTSVELWTPTNGRYQLEVSVLTSDPKTLSVVGWQEDHRTSNAGTIQLVTSAQRLNAGRQVVTIATSEPATITALQLLPVP